MDMNANALAFLSGPQFFIALLAGVVMAFAFQFVLSNLSIAAGISAGINPGETETKGWGKKIRRIEAKVGTTTLFIVNIALFIACFLAVKLTLIQDAGLGAIVAVVIWSVYFLVLMWLSSQAIGSLVGAVGNTAGSGLQGVMATMATALSGGAASSQISNAVETSIETVTKELRSSLSSDQLRENLENYIGKLRLSQPKQAGNANQELSQMLASALPTIDRSEFFNLIQSATPEDLTSGKLREQLTRILGLGQSTNGHGSNGHNNGESQAKQGVGLRERTLQLGTDALLATLAGRSGLSSQSIETLTRSLGSLGQQLGEQAQQVIPSRSQNPAFVIRSDVEHYLLDSPEWYLRPDSLDHGFREVLFDPDADAQLIRQQLEQLNRSYFVEVLNRRKGINPEQINDIADELELIRREVLDAVYAAVEQEQSQALGHRVEAFLQSAPKEILTSEQAQQDFTALLVDPGANYETLGNRLLQFDRDRLMQLLLAGRQDLSPEETEQILNQLEAARDRFLNQSQETWQQLQEQAIQFRQQVELYLRDTNATELTFSNIQQTLQTLLENPSGGLLAIRTGLGQLDRANLEQILTQRQDVNPEQVNQLLHQVEAIRDNILYAPQQLTEQGREQVNRLTQQIGEYLRNTNLQELNPEGIQRDLQTLLSDPQAGIVAWRDRLSHVDRETLVALLSQRQDLSEEQVNQTIDQVVAAINGIVRAPRELARRTRDRVQDLQSNATERIRGYLNSLDQPELNYEGLQRDFRKLFDDPEAGLEALRERLSQFDRDTLVALLSSRSDISEAQANRIVDQIEQARDSVLQRAEQLQAKAEERIQVLKHQAKEQAEEIQKTVASAAWWLFGTALTSVTTAAISGLLATGGLK